MSYDIHLNDPVTKQTIELENPHFMRGGTYAIGGTKELSLNITYNYACVFCRPDVLGEKGIRSIYGKTGAESIPVSEDYSQYVFPALRALEGHIKYLLTVAGRTAKRNFDCFNLDTSNTPPKYIVSAPLTDATKKDSIENCYNYYKLQRDTIFHFGDILGSVDNTRFITSKDKANEIINKCIELICTQQ